MKKIFLALGLLFLLFPQVASAQSQRNPCFYATSIGARDGCTSVSTANPLPVAASVSASITGFTPNGNFANLTATNVSASVALPAGTTIAVQNTGTSTVSCTLGVGSATAVASQIQVAASSTVFVTPGSNTFLGCIDQTGSTSNVVALAGGAGLGAGFGGGGGGAGGGTSSAFNAAFPANGTAIGLSDGTNMKNWLAAIALADGVNGNNTGATAPWLWNGVTYDRARGDATNGLWVNIKAGSSSGAVAQGSTTAGQTGGLTQAAVTTAAPAYTTAQTSPLSLTTAGELRTFDTQLLAAVNNPIPFGTNVIGKVTIDQTTPGTTNLVAIGPVGSGVQATAPRLTLATDSPGIISAGTPTATAALAANLVAKASAGTLFSFEASADSTLSAAAWWVMIYNATSAPADGAVTPLKCYAVPSGTTSYSAAFTAAGIAFSTGITLGVSTTGCFTKTASTHAFISADFQ